jgi:demethylmenaquinone methyltransferase/2-methoxy-6-polyprenyl-1,4-benzoquinol methylase
MHLTDSDRAQTIRTMFSHIAPRYELMNRLMTGGQDVAWRREVIRLAKVPRGGKLLDLGAGTGNLGKEARRQYPSSWITAADFTLEMMYIGKSHDDKIPEVSHMDWAGADAHILPFPALTFDAVASGFLLRNVIDVLRCLKEQYRVLKPGGVIVALDTTPPPKSTLEPLIHFYLHNVIPVLGWLIAGQAEAYRYLPDSTEKFFEPERLVSRMVSAGFRNVRFRRYMFGTIAIYWGRK